VKNLTLIRLILAVIIVTPLSAMSGTFDGSQPLVCAVIETYDCNEGIECERGLAGSINLPQFIRIDFKKKTISGTLPNGMVKTTEIKNMETHVGSLILQGVQREMGWSIAIAVETGKMNMTMASESVGFSVFGACIPSGSEESQDASVFGDPEQFDMLWSTFLDDKKILISQTLGLTHDESTTFWPVFDAFQHKMKEISQANFNLLITYISKYETLTDDQAGKLVDEYLSLETRRIALKRSYVEKFKQIISPKKMMRYYQLESKIEATLKFEIAVNTPVVE